MPVAAPIGVIDRHHDLVAGTRPYLVITARTAVRLDRLVRLDVAHVDVTGESVVVPARRHQRPRSAHAMSATITTNATPTTIASLLRSPRREKGL